MPCYPIQLKHLVRTRKRLMYCQELPLPCSPLCPFPLLALLSDHFGFRRSSVFAEEGGRNASLMNLNLISAQSIPDLPCSPSSPSLCHPDCRNL